MPAPEFRRLRAQKAAITRWRPDADTTDLDRGLKVASAEEYIRELVESAPPLRPEDLERLRNLLPAPTADQSGGEPDAA